MLRFARLLTAGLLLAGAALTAGCGGNAAGLTTSSTGGDSKVPSNDDPLARPTFVAWTSARAKRCGFFFDAAKLKASYLAYESKQGKSAGDLANFERVYDQTFKSTSDSAWASDDYCTEKKGAEIKQELARHLGGDYAPNFPKPKVVADCGIFGCSPGASEEPFDSKKFWQKNDADRVSGRGR
ncbi:MAG TPA: hypothetical protein VFR19_18100 [Hyphomicrobiaceae bacterium]|jgi:hypothetical protein|nr:hypothetical protein [Hyphomicrobiaceae bacterium]